ncbi:MAG TPA: RNA polymerase factor sigma-54 [Stellaceae bacterium]|jgi:RNA polymerase sigma-54 factor
MAFSQRLELRQTQALVMTPQLQQAIKLLQLSNVELASFIETELEQNPLLERDEGGGAGDADGGAAGDGDAAAPADRAETGSADDFADGPSPGESAATGAGAPDGGGESFGDGSVEQWHAEAGSDGEGNLDFAGDPEAWRTHNGRLGGDGDDLPGLEHTLADKITLREHLTSQLAMTVADPVDRLIGTHLVDLVDEAGYLTADLTGIAQLLGCDIARVEQTLRVMQRFDPPGIFARNLAECLAIQLRERDRLDPAMQALLDHLQLLANRDAAALMRICGVDAEDLAQMATEIRSLNPKPGLAFDAAVAQPVTPDIMMRAQPGGGWIIELNNDTLPRVLVSARYYARISRATRDKAEKEYITERFQSANWLVKSLHQRANTILRVATEIVHQQDAFFLRGIQHLRPLILRDIAEAIGMHESTVSRVTTNKYMATPRGIYELKYFFTSAIPAARGGDAHSAEAVRFRIKALVDAETANGILSDEQIVEILQKDGVDIARRTVAKYREALRIPSSVQRRREKMLGL